MNNNDVKWELISDEEYDDEPIFIEDKNSLLEDKKSNLTNNNFNILNILKYPTKILKYLIFFSMCFFKNLF